MCWVSFVLHRSCYWPTLVKGAIKCRKQENGSSRWFFFLQFRWCKHPLGQLSTQQTQFILTHEHSDRWNLEVFTPQAKSNTSLNAPDKTPHSISVQNLLHVNSAWPHLCHAGRGLRPCDGMRQGEKAVCVCVWVSEIITGSFSEASCPRSPETRCYLNKLSLVSDMRSWQQHTHCQASVDT